MREQKRGGQNPDLVGSKSPDSERDRARKAEVLRAVTPVVEENLGLLLDPRKAWQPSLILPDPHTPDFSRIAEEARFLSPEVKIVVVGALITEEGLPNFTAEMARYGDSDGVDTSVNSPWEVWRRGWASEEHRHEKLLGMYLRDSGGFNVTQIERDTQSFIAAGFNASPEHDTYGALMYTAWQEPATRDSHQGQGKLAKEAGAEFLHRVSGVMSGDEGRHALFYRPVAKRLFELDPEGAIESLGRLVGAGLTMPGATMPGFNQFLEASTLSGAYGPKEYVAILGDLLKNWQVEEISLTGEADKTRHEIIDRHARLAKIAGRGVRRPKSDALKSLEQRWLKQ